MRERLSRIVACFVPIRITPAYAGKTKKRQTSEARSKDHPRLCGKDFFTTNSLSLSSGSPPLMRERQETDCLFEQKARITPAYAGKTEVQRLSKK